MGTLRSHLLQGGGSPRRAPAMMRVAVRLLPYLALALSSCSTDLHDHEGPMQKIRPTIGDSSVFDGYGDEPALFVDSNDGRVRVWYVENGPHRTSSVDENPADGVPDFVQTIADTADAVYLSITADGFLAPIEDTSVPGQENDGNSSAFDIYIVDFQRADGLFFAEGCLPGEPVRCTGYFAIKNGFGRSGYASDEEAITVLVSHEYFHAVQAAYNADLPGWWSEGTATWHEEYFEPSQNDFERLATTFFEAPGRALNGNTQGTTDTFAYGTGVFPFFLEQTLGVEVIVDIFDRVALNTPVETAIMEAVEARAPFDATFAEFTAWTIATGERTIEGFGFLQAAQFPAIEATVLDGGNDLNWDVEVRTWASQIAEIDRSRDISLSVRPLEGWPLTPLLVVVDPATTGEWTVVREGETLNIRANSQPVYAALLNADPDARTAGRLAIRGATIATPDEPGDGSSESPAEVEPIPLPSADDSSGCSSVLVPGSRGVMVLSGVLALLLRRRQKLAGS
jgi:hypothetical protein